MYAGIAGGILVCLIAAGLSFRHIKKRRLNGEDEKEVDEEDVGGDLKSRRSASKRNTSKPMFRDAKSYSVCANTNSPSSKARTIFTRGEVLDNL